MPAVPPPPALGYGAPYRGTGEGIYVKDSRTDWDITEGHHKITSEQALEAAGDPEYEARRQIAKAYNDRLHQEGQAHHARGYHLIEAGALVLIAGAIATFVVAPKLQTHTDNPATATDPETSFYRSGPATELVANAGLVAMIAGALGIPYGWYGGSRPPPYHEWHTPEPLNRPAYVRQQTEPYNAKIGAPSMPDADTGTQPDVRGLPAPPGVTPPRRMPHPRGGQ